MKHRSWIVLSGYLWFAIGGLLLYKGLGYITEAAFFHGTILNRIFESEQQGAMALIALGLFIGFVKGRFVLSKTVRRVVGGIVSKSEPVTFKNAYSPSYWILISFMMLMGMALKFVPIPIDIRGLIDVSVGSALINGAMLYFRAARALNYSF